MFGLTSATRIYLYSLPCDMRKSFDGLSGLVRQELGEDPLSGSLFVFCNRRRNMAKLLYWDRDGIMPSGSKDWKRADSAYRSGLVRIIALNAGI